MLTPFAEILIRLMGAERPRRPCEDTCRRRRHFVHVGIW